MTERIWYVYGIVPAELELRDAPAGLEGSAVALERAGDVAALVSLVDAVRYGSDPLASHAGDMDWLGPRAIAHDAVVSWASERGPVVPLPMFSMFTDAASLHAMLDERRPRLVETLDRIAPGREYGLRVFRLDGVLREQLDAVSPRIAELAAAAAAAPPGQRYLLERKLDAEKKTELRRVGQEVAGEIFATLRGVAMDGVVEPLAAKQEGEGAAVLNAAFLVRRDGFQAFQDVLTELVTRHERHGFRFAFTGPWPPYHFVREGADDV